MSKTGTVELERGQRAALRRERLARRLTRWPLLRLLVVSPAFRFVVLGLFFSAVGAALLVLKIWVVTPPHVKPPVRISWLDRIQNWSLKRNARAALSRGDYDTALAAWRAGWANNPADATAIRGGLETVLRISTPADQHRLALRMGGWLAHLGYTNAADLDLIGRAWNRCDLHEDTVRLLTAYPHNWTHDLYRLYAISLFETSRTEEFHSLMSKNPDLLAEVMKATERGEDETPPAQELEFHAVSLAYLAGWGPVEKRRLAMERLRKLRDLPGLDTLPYGLELITHVKARDSEACAEILRELQNKGKAKVEHHIAYWHLLTEEGQKQRAIELFKQANPVPGSLREARKLVALLSALELYEEAEAVAREHFDDLNTLQEGALMRGDLLTRLNRWDDLRQLALQVRSIPRLMEDLGGYSYYLEGLAALNQGPREDAVTALRRAAETGLPTPALAQRAAETLMRYGPEQYPFAEALLLPHKEAYRNNPAALMLLIRCAYQSKHTDYLWEVASQLYKIAPRNPVAINNYAATLLILRTNTEAAVRLTFDLLQAQPNSAAANLNHAIALMMNGRLEEAEQIMERVDPTRRAENAPPLDPAVAAQFYLAKFELRVRQGRKDEALALAPLIDQSQLYPVQLKWLLEQRAELDKVQSTSASAPPPG